jgi:hypothetical protein
MIFALLMVFLTIQGLEPVVADRRAQHNATNPRSTGTASDGLEESTLR